MTLMTASQNPTEECIPGLLRVACEWGGKRETIINNNITSPARSDRPSCSNLLLPQNSGRSIQRDGVEENTTKGNFYASVKIV